MRSKKKYICLLLAAVFLLTGCQDQAATGEIKAVTETEVKQERYSMLDEPSVEYETEKMNPSILVSMSGYETTCEKVAVLENSKFPVQFQLINSETEEVVYTGSIEVRSCSEDNEILSALADFSEYDEPGRYYIKTEMLGRSKDFFISEINRKDRVTNTLKTIHSYQSSDNEGNLKLESSSDIYIDASGGWITDKSGNKDLIEGCLTIMDLLLAYELHPTVFTDDFGLSYSGNGQSDLIDEIKFEADWLKKMQNPETGGAYTGVYIPEGKSESVVGGETTRATAYFCAAMAMLSRDLAKVDGKYSYECLQAATLAWNCLVANKEIVTIEQMYRAAVEMYRVTGQAVYLNVINEYLGANQSMDYESRAMLDAAITYMSTSRKVNVAYCTSLMQQYMARTEEKSNAALKSRYYVEPDRDVSVLLRNATELIVADNIISNQEYENIEMNYVYYLSGRNHECVDYTKALDNVNQYAQLLVLVTELADKKHK